MSKKIIMLTVLLAFTIALRAQNVNIPDPNFKQCLLQNPGINEDGNSEISYTEARSYQYSIECKAMGIRDLEGVRAFDSIIALDVSNNELERILFGQHENKLLSFSELSF